MRLRPAPLTTLPRAVRLIGLSLLLVGGAISFLATACAPRVSLREEALAATDGGEYDRAIALYERALQRAAPEERPAIEAGLRAARAHAATPWWREADAAVAAHHLAGAEAALAEARKVAGDIPEQLRRERTLSTTRARVEEQVALTRAQLTKLADADLPADPLRWKGLARDVAEAARWQHDVPAALDLQRDARAKALEVLGDTARMHGGVDDWGAARDAWLALTAFAPDAPAVRALGAEIEAGAAVNDEVRKGNAALAALTPREALEHFRSALARAPGHSEARAGHREAARQLLERAARDANAAWKARDRAAAWQALQPARDVRLDDTPAQAAYDAAAKRVDRYVRARTRAAFDAAWRQRRRRPATAWLLAEAWRQSGDPRAAKDRRLQDLDTLADALATYRLRGPRPSVDPERDGPEVVALDAAVRAELERLASTAELQGAGVRLVPADTRDRQVDGALTMAVRAMRVERSADPATRTVRYVHHTEQRPNPAWQVAQGAVSTTLALMNAASDQVRPLEQQWNDAVAQLPPLEGKRDELLAQIKREDTAYYEHHPSPCADGGISCPETKAHKRWAARLAWYEGKIAKRRKAAKDALTRLEDARRAFAKARAAFEDAEAEAQETPRTLPHEVEAEHSYEVIAHRLEVEVDVEVRWLDGVDTRAPVVRARAVHRIADSFSDVEHMQIDVAGKTLVAEKAAQLPEAATLTARVAERLVEALAPSLGPPLSRHADRLGDELAAAPSGKRGDAERLELAIRVYLERAAASPALRERARAILRRSIGFDPERGRFEPTWLLGGR